MTTATQAKPNPLPALLVYGTPSGPAMTQASWFRAEDVEAVKAAAKELKFSVIELQTDADKALAAGAHEGVLKGSGRMIVGSVSAEVYRRIEEHARKAETARRPSSDRDPRRRRTRQRQRRRNPFQNKTRTLAWQGRARRNPSRATPAAPASAKPDSGPARETLRVGARVLAAHWNEKREFEGFWLATVKRIEPGEYTLEWFDASGYPPFKSRPQDIAVPHPEFRVSGK